MERKIDVVEDFDGKRIVFIHDIIDIKKEMSTHFQSEDLTQ